MVRHWKTSLAGLALALGQAWQPFVMAVEGGPIDWERLGLATATAIVLWFARDSA